MEKVYNLYFKSHYQGKVMGSGKTEEDCLESAMKQCQEDIILEDEDELMYHGPQYKSRLNLDGV